MISIFKIIYGLYLGLAAIVCFFLIAPLVPVVKDIRILAVLTGSMEPVIHANSIVVVAPAKNYRIGDVVTFGEISTAHTPITHRIQAIEAVDNQPVYTTKGDANSSPDGEKVLLSQVDGKVLFTVPYLGYALNFFRRPAVFVFAIIVPAIVVVLEESKNIWREIANGKKETENV
jgi:signal peptidase